MFAPLPFALHATAGCPPHAELALSLACSFEAVDAAALDAELDALAERLPEPAGPHSLDELERRWLAKGLYDQALQAAQLRMCLPFDATGVARPSASWPPSRLAELAR